jgi:hypothetical protein
MRHVTTISSLLFILFLCSTQTVSAQLVQVRIGLPRPEPRVVVVERPPCPSHDHVWVEGHYVYDSYTRRDVWIPGQWAYVAPRCEPREHSHERGHAYGHRKNKDKDRDRDRYSGRD